MVRNTVVSWLVAVVAILLLLVGVDSDVLFSHDGKNEKSELLSACLIYEDQCFETMPGCSDEHRNGLVYSSVRLSHRSISPRLSKERRLLQYGNGFRCLWYTQILSHTFSCYKASAGILSGIGQHEVRYYICQRNLRI